MLKISLPKTISVVRNCWDAAEKMIRSDVSDSFPGSGEEFLTELLHGTLAKSFRAASDRHDFERAFLADLEAGFIGFEVKAGILEATARGITGTVLHHKGTESDTGGDIGVTLARPLMTRSYGEQHCIYRSSERSGVLAQAKLRGADGKWRELTETQVKVLPNHLDASALLLYEYADAKRRTFRPLAWQSLRSAKKIANAERWLKTNSFPSVLTSSEMIRHLSEDKLGTTNQSIIDTVIAPPHNTYLEVRIDWPDGSEPGSKIYVHSRYEQTQPEVVYQRA